MAGGSTKKSLFEVIGTLKGKWGTVEKIVTAIVGKLPEANSEEIKKWNGAYIIKKNCDRWTNAFQKLENASIKKCDPEIKKLLNVLTKDNVNISFVGNLTIEGKKGSKETGKNITGTPIEILQILQKDSVSESTITKKDKSGVTTSHPARYVLPMLEKMKNKAQEYVTIALNGVDGLQNSETGLTDCLLGIKYLSKLLVDLKER